MIPSIKTPLVGGPASIKPLLPGPLDDDVPRIRYLPSQVIVKNIGGAGSLDSAIYEPTTSKIFGVRGQWLYKFDATSGALMDSKRFASIAQTPSSITALGGKLYIATSSPMVDDSSATVHTPCTHAGDIYVVDATSFTVTGAWNFPVVMAQPVGSFRTITTNGTSILLVSTQYGSGYTGNFPDSVVVVNPASVGSFVTGHPPGFYADLVYDPIWNVLWVADSSGDIIALAPDFSNFCDVLTPSLVGTAPVGITYSTAQARVYCTRGSRYLWKVNPTDAFPGFNNFTATQIDTTRTTSLAYRLKAVNGLPKNPYSDKILIPTYSDDCVLVWDPSSDTLVSTKTGFSSPIDVVNTPDKSFAVQQGNAGLKEIT